jgi:hypothetical protein
MHVRTVAGRLFDGCADQEKMRQSTASVFLLDRSDAGPHQSGKPSFPALLVLILARPDIKSVSELTGKTIVIDDRYSASNSSVRTALVAAGAPEVQLNEGQIVPGVSNSQIVRSSA